MAEYECFGAVALTGGSDGALDTIDGTDLIDGDFAIVVDATNDIVYHYTLNATSAAAESSPDVISPDSNAGDKRWILVSTSRTLKVGDTYIIITDTGTGQIDYYFDTVNLLRMKASSDDIVLFNPDNSGQIHLTANDSGGNEDTLATFNPDGAATLYNAGTAILSTTATGISITDGTATAATIEFSSDNLHIVNNDNSGKILLRAKAAGGTIYDLFNGDPDDSTSIWHASSNEARFYTTTTGFNLFTTATARIGFGYDSNTHWIHGFIHGEPIVLRSEDASGNTKTLFDADPDGAAELYYAGRKTVETLVTGTLAGVSFYDYSGDLSAQIYTDDAAAGLTTFRTIKHGAPFEIRGENAAGTQQVMFYSDPDSAAASWQRTEKWVGC